MPNPFPSGTGYLEATGSCKMLHFDLGFVTSRGSRTPESLSGCAFPALLFLKVSWGNRLYEPAPPCRRTAFTFVTTHLDIKYVSCRRTAPIAWILRSAGANALGLPCNVCCRHRDRNRCCQCRRFATQAKTHASSPVKLVLNVLRTGCVYHASFL